MRFNNETGNRALGLYVNAEHVDVSKELLIEIVQQIAKNCYNDGFDEIFLNNIGQPNKLFRILDNNKLEQLELTNALEKTGLGTGAAVADLNGDGILELLIAHGESAPEPLSLFSANVKDDFQYLIYSIRVTSGPEITISL